MASNQPIHPFSHDVHFLVGNILSHDITIQNLQNRITAMEQETDEKNDLIIEFEDTWQLKKKQLESLSLPDLNDIYNKVNIPWTPDKKKKKIPVKRKKVSKATKSKIMYARLAQQQHGSQKEQWSFLQWNNKATRKK